MEIRFSIDTDRLTVGDMLLIEDAQDGRRPMHKMTELMGRFMVDPNGAPLESGEAVALLSGLTIAQFSETAKSFAEGLKANAVPPMNSAS